MNYCLLCNKETSVLYKGEPYCVKHWKIKYKEKGYESVSRYKKSATRL